MKSEKIDYREEYRKAELLLKFIQDDLKDFCEKPEDKQVRYELLDDLKRINKFFSYEGVK